MNDPGTSIVGTWPGMVLERQICQLRAMKHFYDFQVPRTTCCGIQDDTEDLLESPGSIV
jgi:hypothetical protein